MSIKDRKNLRIKHTEGVCEFIVKLIEIMQVYFLVFKAHPDMVFWSSDGDSRKFRNLDELERTVMPTYFRHSNRLSFIRQVFSL